MKILFLLGRCRPPGDEPDMYRDLAKEFLSRGHSVRVVAEAIDISVTCESMEQGIHFLRVPVPLRYLPGFFAKGLRQLFLPWAYYLALRSHPEFMQCDLIITATPPTTLAYLIQLLKKRNRASVYLILRDFVGQTAVDLKLTRKSWPIHIWLMSHERRLVNVSDRIGCMTQANVDFAMTQYAMNDKAKLCLLPNFARFPNCLALTSQQHDLPTSPRMFNAVYAGNMGKPQGLERLLDLAERCSGLTDVSFIFIGDGTEKKRLQTHALRRGIQNVRFLDPVSMAELADLFRVCSIGLISLHPELTVPCCPSKLLTYLYCGLPVLASLNRNNDLAEIILRQGVGLSADANDLDSLYRAFYVIYSNAAMRGDMSVACQKAFHMEHSTALAYNRICEQAGLSIQD